MAGSSTDCAPAEHDMVETLQYGKTGEGAWDWVQARAGDGGRRLGQVSPMAARAAASVQGDCTYGRHQAMFTCHS